MLGAQAHVLQGAGGSGRTFVAYGMGNFIWYGTSRSTETGVLLLTLRGRDVVKRDLTPAVMSTAGQPVPSTGSEADRVKTRFAALRACAGLSTTPG